MKPQKPGSKKAVNEPTRNETKESLLGDNKANLSRITLTPGQRSAQPCIRNLRITVWEVLDMLASGMTESEILNDYPYLERPDFPAIYSYASQVGRDRFNPTLAQPHLAPQS